MMLLAWSVDNDYQFAYDAIGFNTGVKFVNSNWPVSIPLVLVKLIRGLFVGFLRRK